MEERAAETPSSDDASVWRMDCGNGGRDFALWREYLMLLQAARWGSLVDATDKKLGARDCLVVVDMQNDFVPVDSVNPHGGAFGVAEGAQTAPLIVQLMEQFAAAGGLVVCTRDYHPMGHCSWLENGGPFPRHCVQGTVGSHFYKPIGDTLDKLRQLDRRAEVVFKGFHEDTDSFGAITYDSEYANGRLTQVLDPDHLHGCSLCDWTGSMVLKCSALDMDVNAPPDVMSVLSRKSLKDFLAEGSIDRIFVCGLALDFCVFDTCLNAAKNNCGEVFMILDAARAAHISHVGSIGTGFLNDPVKMCEQMRVANVKVVPTAALVSTQRTPSGLACKPDPLSHAMLGKEFPDTLGPFALVKVGDVGLSVDVQKLAWSAVDPKKGSQVQVLRRFLHEPSGATSPLSRVTLSGKARALLGISQSATSYLWAYPINAHGMTDQQRGYFALTTPEAAFFIFGGFVYLDSAGKVTDVMALALGKGLNFEAPRRWTDNPSLSKHINWQPVTAPLLRAKGARTFTWISPQDGINMAGRDWKGLEHGAFVYRFSEDGATSTDKDVYFAVSPVSKDEGMVAHGRSGNLTAPTKVQPAQPKSAWEATEKPPGPGQPKAGGGARTCLVQ